MLSRELRDAIPAVVPAIQGGHPPVLFGELDGLQPVAVAGVVGVNVCVPVHALYRAQGGEIHPLLPSRGRDDAGPRQRLERRAEHGQADEVYEDRHA